VPTDDGSVRLGGIFNIIDSILTGAEQVFSQVGAKVPGCVVYWEDGGTNGTYYWIDTNRIYLRGGTSGNPGSGDDDSYDDPVILHEYGHFVTDQYSYINPSANGLHSVLSYYPPPLTWSEGWVTAFQAMVRGSALYWDSLDGDATGFNIDYERGAYNQIVRPEFRGMNNEGAVICVLYDLFDSSFSGDTSPGEDDEAFAFGMDSLWQVVDLDFAPGIMATMDDFYQGWRDRFPGLEVDSAFARFGMEFVPLAENEFVFSSTDLGLTIPVGVVREVTADMVVPPFSENKILPGGVAVWAAIDHPNARDLVIRLRHPDGTRVTLKAPGTGGGEDVAEWYGYPRYTFPAESLSAFDWKSPAGVWTLEVSNEGWSSSGILLDWRLKLKTGQAWGWKLY